MTSAETGNTSDVHDEQGPPPAGNGSMVSVAGQQTVEPVPARMRRLHPLTPFFRSWRLVAGTAAVGLGVFRDDLDRLRWVWQALHGDVEMSLVAKSVAIIVAVGAVALAGAWLSWRATGFAIVHDQAGPGTLAFHRGVLAKQRSQVRLNRVQSVDVNQPLVPRLCGLAAVRLEMAAGEEASVDLAYLRLDEAVELRSEILRHTSTASTQRRTSTAPTQPTTSADQETAAPTDLADGGATGPQTDTSDRLLARASTRQVIRSNLLDGISAWVMLVVWVVALVVAPILMGRAAFVAALSGVIPVTLAIVAQLRRQVLSMMRDANFTLLRTPTGVRISSGLTSTVNRTVDLDRIQGVRLVEPFWWRRFGWARVKMDIAGGSDDFEKGASLIPVTTRSEALALIAAVTGAAIESAPFVEVGPGARRVDPVGWRYLGVALLREGAVSRAGRWRRSTSFVPYARVQSVSAHQGPVQRRLGLATVYLDVPKGSKRWEAQHRGTEDAAQLVETLADRARLHRLHRRSADPPPRPVDPRWRPVDPDPASADAGARHVDPDLA
ncbi:MAG: PH domain-containing protein [Propionibacteriales bacterium]|nr:PH domain-containing protein [Propionibacteriales bacterium]